MKKRFLRVINAGTYRTTNCQFFQIKRILYPRENIYNILSGISTCVIFFVITDFNWQNIETNLERIQLFQQQNYLLDLILLSKNYSVNIMIIMIR